MNRLPRDMPLDFLCGKSSLQGPLRAAICAGVVALVSVSVAADGPQHPIPAVPSFVPMAKVAAAGCNATRAPSVRTAADPRMRTVTTAGDLHDAIADLRAGDVLELAAGRYKDLRIAIPATASGTADRPIIVRAAAGVTLSGLSHILVEGQFVTVQGFAFENANVPWGSPGALYGACIQLAGADNRATQCRFTNCGEAAVGWRHIVHIPNPSKRNRVDSCTFINSQCIPAGLKDGPGAEGNTFSHNLIDGNNPRVEKNWRVAIQIGQGAFDESRTTVEYNTVRNFTGPESIGIKSTRCIVRNNLVVDSEAPLGVRAGNSCEIRDNVILHSIGGIMLTGRGHVVEGNCVVADRVNGNSPLFLHCEAYKDGQQFYQLTTDCLVRGNIFAVLPPNSITPVIQTFAWLQDVRGVPSRNRFEGNVIVGHKGISLIGSWDESKKTTAEDFVKANSFTNNRFWLVDAAGAAEVKLVGDILGRDGNLAAAPEGWQPPARP